MSKAEEKNGVTGVPEGYVVNGSSNSHIGQSAARGDHNAVTGISKGDAAALNGANDIITAGQASGNKEQVAAGQAALDKVLANNGLVIYRDPQARAEGDANTSSGTSAGGGSGTSGGTTGSGTKSRGKSVTSDMESSLGTWLATATAQQKKSVDYAVNQGVKELERAQEDAQKQYDTQQKQTDADEAKALDNQALYAEARGDRGGIGQAQYAQIQNTAMNNRRAINDARTKLATNTARQIADLRAQGEFQKADAILQLTQTYLTQLMDLQKWGAEYTLSEAQFLAQLEQWKASLAIQEASLTGDYKGQKTHAVKQAEQQRLADAGIASLEAGFGLTDEQLAAITAVYGYGQEWVDAVKANQQAAQAAKTQEQLLATALEALTIPNCALSDEQVAVLKANGYTDSMIKAQQDAARAKFRKETYIAPAGGSGKSSGAPSYLSLLEGGYDTEEEIYLELVGNYGFTDAEATMAMGNFANWKTTHDDTLKSVRFQVNAMLGSNSSYTLGDVLSYLSSFDDDAFTSQEYQSFLTAITTATGLQQNQWDRNLGKKISSLRS